MTDSTDWQPPADDRPAVPAYGEYQAPGASPRYPAAPPPSGWAPPPRPGLIPLRPLAFGTLLWAPFQVLRRNPKATFGSALIVQAVVTLAALLVVGAVTYFAVDRISSAPVDERDTVAAGSLAAIVLSAIVPLALSVIGSALLQGVIVLEVARATLGEKLRLGALWRAASKRLSVLILWTLILGGVVLGAVAVIAGLVGVLLALGQAWVPLAVVTGIVGALALVAASAWVGTKVSLVPSLIVLERLRIRRAVARSWSLTNGYFWRTLGVQFLVAAIVNIVTQIVTTPVSLVFTVTVSVIDPNSALDAFVPSIILYAVLLFVSLVMAAIAAVVQSATTALIYIDLRMRKEGLDLDLAQFVEASSTGRTTGQDPYRTPAHRMSPGVAPEA